MARVKYAATDCLTNMAASISRARNDVTVKTLYGVQVKWARTLDIQPQRACGRGRAQRTGYRENP